MTARERVRKAIRHQPHDRIPVDLGGTSVTGITAAGYRELCAELGLPAKRIRIFEPMQMLAEVELPLRRKLEVDAVGLLLGGGTVYGWRDWTMPDGTPVEMSADLDLRPQPDGGWGAYSKGKLTYLMAKGGFYFDPVEYPKWRGHNPADLTDELLRDIETRASLCRRETDLAVTLTVPYTIFNGTSPDFLCALMADKEEVHERVEVWVDQEIACLTRLLDAVRDHIDVMCFSGDAGSQRGPLIGPALYREMLLPHFRRVPEFLHKHSDIKFFYHTCGSVYRLMECFVELGVDILNPVQVSAAEMEPERLVREFGGRLVFWGGGCDTQRVLPHGTEAEVREEVRNRLRHFASVPGFVFTAVHNIQPDVPPRNILAMYDEVRRWKPGSQA